MSAVLSASPNPGDHAALKKRQQAAWSTGDYAVVGTTLQIVGETLCEAIDLRAGSRVLDVAAGNGNATLAAARRWCEVTSTDYVPALLAAGRARAEAEGHAVTFQHADAEDLPFADASFDVVLSTFGVMFAPQQKKAAAEMLRVCRSGGTIALANWTPASFIGQVFRTLGKYLAPPPGVASPALWGTRTRIEELFGDGARDIRTVARTFNFRYCSPAHWLDVFRTYYGPINRAYATLDPLHQAELTRELTALLDETNRSGDRTLVLPSEYLEIIVSRA